MANHPGEHGSAYPRPLVTVDAVVFAHLDPLSADDQAGEKSSRPGVILIRRGREPFAGSWALPGGYLEENEEPAAGAARELREETGLSGLVLRELGAFGSPGRDPRGWTISLAFWAVLTRPSDLTAGDDAENVAWHALDALPPLAFDHGTIIARAAVAAGFTRPV